MSAAKAKNNNTSQRTTKVDKELRVQQIIDKISEGVAERRVVEWIMSEFDVAEKTAYGYHKDAIKRINRKFEEEMPNYRDKMLANLERVYEVAMKVGNFSAALRAQEQIAKIGGLEAPKELKQTHNFEGLENASDEELKRIAAGATS